VLFLQEFKSTEFPATVFTESGYEIAAVTQRGCNGVAVLSLTPIGTISTALAGDGDDTHAAFLK
jgi:exonuclease III